MDGELIGINTAKLSSTEVEGMGYTIPISDVLELIGQLMKQTTDEAAGVLGFHTSRLKITCADETPWTLDGEYGGSPQAAEITACRHAVNIVYGA